MTPETYWGPLFGHMDEEYELTLTDDECHQIARAVDECRKADEPPPHIVQIVIGRYGDYDRNGTFGLSSLGDLFQFNHNSLEWIHLPVKPPQKH